MAETLIIGAAIDGPSAEAFQVVDFTSFEKTFAFYNQFTTLGSSATSFELDYECLAMPGVKINDISNVLFRPVVSGASVFFGSLGYAGSAEFRYRPYLGKYDLVTCAERFIGSSPTVCRIPGVRASLTLGDWVFKAKYEGEKYNSVYISKTSTTLTISGLTPEYSTITCSTTGNYDELAHLLERYYQLGIIPVYLDQHGSTFTTGTSYLSGGLDYDFSAENLRTCLESATDNITSVIVLTEATSSLVNEAVSYLEEYYQTPKPIIFAAPNVDGTIEEYLTDLPTILPSRSDWVGLVLGSGNYSLRNGLRLERFNVESLAGINPLNGFTNKSLDITTLVPTLTAAELDSLAAVGIMAPVRMTGAGISIYRGVMSSGSSLLREAYAIAVGMDAANTFLASYKGKRAVPGVKKEWSSLLESILKDLRLNVIAVEINLFDNVTGNPITRNGIEFAPAFMLLHADIQLQVGREILEISIGVETK